MKVRVVRIAIAVAVMLLALPSVACAQERFSPASLGVHVALSLTGLVVAFVLLVAALSVRKLASGGVVADRIGLVVLSAICLAASALAEWGTSFVIDLTLDQTQLASEVLVIAAMALLAAYFWNVRSGMMSYLGKVAEHYTATLDELVPPASDGPSAPATTTQEGGRA